MSVIISMKLAVDGVTVVDDQFPVKGQHNWIRFPLSLSSGSHSLTAESDTGATLKESFQVPGDKARYAVVNYWADEEPCHPSSNGSSRLTPSTSANPCDQGYRICLLSRTTRQKRTFWAHHLSFVLAQASTRSRASAGPKLSRS